MPEIFFTADTHFGHTVALSFDGTPRPFATIEEHDEHLVERWNSVIGRKDKVWHLGDFALSTPEAGARIFRRLNGDKHLITGNHDRQWVEDLGWGSVHVYHETAVNKQRIVLSHYAMRVWNAKHHGAVMLYGHSHGQLPGNRQSLDVGVDAWNWTPAAWPEIRARLDSYQEPGFGHGDEIAYSFALTPFGGELHVFDHGEMPLAENLVRVRFRNAGGVLEAKAADIVELRKLLGTPSIRTVVRHDAVVDELEDTLNEITRLIEARVAKHQDMKP